MLNLSSNTSNPALKNINNLQNQEIGINERMTIQGTVNKTFTAVIVLIIFFALSWTSSTNIPTLTVIGGIAGFIVALITIFKKTLSPFTVPIYAALEGIFLGGISALFEKSYPGIAIQAAGLTIGTLFCMISAYKSKLIKPTEKFRSGIITATMGIALFYIVSMILSLFGFKLNAVYGNSLLSIGFSLFVVIIAALSLILDFKNIEDTSRGNNPKYLEWYCAFGLLVTLIWLYVEILRLLAKIQSRD